MARFTLRTSAVFCLACLTMSFARAQSTSGTAEVTAGQCDTLRRLYIMQPDVVPSYLAQINDAAEPDLHLRYSLSHNGEALLEELDRICLDATGNRLLQDSFYSIHLLDSLRLAFYNEPKSFSDDRIEHLESVSRRVSGKSYVQASPVLIALLKQDRARFFRQPEAYESSRLEDLDLVSLLVTSLPFLRGSPDLVARLERARMEYEESDSRFSTERLRQLDTLALQITGEPFLPRRNSSISRALLLGGLTLLLLAAAYGFARTKPAFRQAESAPHSGEDGVMSLAEACRLLSVEPDADYSEIARAYRREQKRYHPDLVAHLGEDFMVVAERRTRELNQAHELLRKRARGPSDIPDSREPVHGKDA